VEKGKKKWGGRPPFLRAQGWEKRGVVTQVLTSPRITPLGRGWLARGRWGTSAMGRVRRSEREEGFSERYKRGEESEGGLL